MPAADPSAAREDEAQQRSFFAELLAEAHPEPYRLPEVLIEYLDHRGPYSERVLVELDVPDDEQVAALDGCGGALDELEVLAGDPDTFDDLLDALDVLGWSPAAAADAALAHWHLDRPPEGGWLALVERINLYGPGLEYDLWDRGHDLAVYFRGERPWDHLLRVSSRLPAGSHYRSAMADDDELAAAIAEVHGPPSKRRGSSRPALEGFTTEVGYLHRIESALRFVGWAVFASQAGKKRGSPPKSAKGPETADERFERLDAAREHEEVVSQVLVRRGGSAARGGRAWVPGGPQPERPPGSALEAVRGAVLLDP